MQISISEMAAARETLHALLEEAGLSAYRFQLDPQEAGWRLAVECAADGGWMTCHLDVAARSLADARRGGAPREALLAHLVESLSACDRDERS